MWHAHVSQSFKDDDGGSMEVIDCISGSDKNDVMEWAKTSAARNGCDWIDLYLDNGWQESYERQTFERWEWWELV